MKRNKVILIVLTTSLVFFLIVIALLSMRVITQELLTSKLFSVVIPLVTGVVVGVTIIVGYFYLIRSGKLQEKYKTLPVYGIAVILEAIGEVFSEKYAFIFMILSTLLLVLAIAVDIRKKIGIYLLFKNRHETKGSD